MSVPVTEKPIVVAPNNTDPVLVPYTTGAAWSFGDWEEVIAATSDVTYVAGVSIAYGSTWSGLQAEIDVGTGTAGNEVSLGSHIRIFGPNSGEGSNAIFLIPIPFGVIPAGARVSLRLRIKGTQPGLTLPIALLYYEGAMDLPWVNSADYPLTSIPAGADAVSITPDATPWADSTIVELDDGIGNDVITVLGLVVNNGVDSTATEYDLLGGDPGEEVVLTTFRNSTKTRVAGFIWYVMLPAPYPVPAETRLSMRVRQSSTDTANPYLVALLVYDGNITRIPAPPTPEPSEAFYIRRERQFLLPSSDDNKTMFCSVLELLPQPGVGLISGQGDDPQVMLSISRDGGQTFGPERWESAGEQGQYKKRVRWLRNGRWRNGVAKIVVSDPVDWQFVRMSGEFTEGSS